MQPERSTDSLSTLINRQQYIILDGGLGTELERRGVTINNTKLWSAQLLIDNPSVLRDIHRDYLLAGADVITTCTYQASIEGFLEQGKTVQEACHLLRLAAQLACDARDEVWQNAQPGIPANDEPAAGDKSSNTQQVSSNRLPERRRPLVGFSAGCYGASLADGSEFRGDYAETVSEQQLQEFHMSRIEPVLEDPQVWSRLDLLCFETVPCLKEVKAICHLLSSDPRLHNCQAWVSCSCKDSQRTRHGESFAEEVVPVLWSCDQVVAIGVNCTEPVHLPSLLSAAKSKLSQLQQHQDDGGATSCESTELRLRTSPAPVLICYPNSGEQWNCETRSWFCDQHTVAEPQQYAQAAKTWVASGAVGVGGCCRTCPDHIRALRQLLIQK